MLANCLFRPYVLLKNECLQEEKTPSASVESIPEVLEECTSVADHSDSASVHDMDYVNPRGVRFTQCSQKEGGYFGIISDSPFYPCYSLEKREASTACSICLYLFVYHY